MYPSFISIPDDGFAGRANDDNFQLVAYGIQKGDQRGSETAVDQKQNGIAVVVLEEITLNALMFNNLLFVLCVRG